MRKSAVLCFGFIALVAVGGSAQDRVTLGDLRSRFLSQRISISQSFSDLSLPFLAEWQFVKNKKGRYVADYGRQVPATFAGRTGTIIAIQAPDPAYGTAPSLQTDSTYVVYGEVIVRLDSGETVETAPLSASSGSGVSDPFVLLSVRDKHKQESVELAKELAGGSLYFTRLTQLYDVGLTTESIQVVKAGISRSAAQIFDFPLLTPLQVLQVGYAEQLDFTLVTLQLPGGRKALYVPGCVQKELTPDHYACAALSMPTFLKDSEVEAIRRGSIFIGMSEAALYMAMGFPKTSNRSLVGPTQLVYLSAYVYIENDKVVEVQDRN